MINEADVDELGPVDWIARRLRRAAVIGPAPVARTVAPVATAAVVTRGVRRRRARR